LKNLLFVLALALAPIAATAAPASGDSIDQLLMASRAETQVESMYGGMEQLIQTSMKQALGDKPISPEQQRVIDQFPGKFATLVRKEFGWVTMKPFYTRLYQESFDQSEVDGLLAFYGSPSGQAYLDRMPVVLQKTMVFVQQEMQRLMPMMRNLMDETLKEANIAR